MDKTRIGFLILLFLFPTFFFAQENENAILPAPYEEDEFPNWAKQIRRTEIVTLGSFPFVTIGVTACYGAYKYASGKTNVYPNPFSTNGAYSKKEILTMAGTAACISVGIGITDLCINYAINKRKARQKAIIDAQNNVIITPLSSEEVRNMLNKEKK